MSKALGKGLEALIQNNNSEESANYLLGKIDIEKVRPNSNQPRNYFNQQKMDELIDSIKQKGILQPITVRELNNGEYTIIAGERRYRAAKEIGLKTIPVYILSVDSESMTIHSRFSYFCSLRESKVFCIVPSAFLQGIIIVILGFCIIEDHSLIIFLICLIFSLSFIILWKSDFFDI